MQSAGQPIESLAEALRSAYPELAAILDAGPDPTYVVGGAVRDLLLGRGRADLDLVVAGDAAALAARLGGAEPVEHERFATAKVVLDGHELDIASARSETYPRPGALPEVVPAASIEEDLARRDFSVNAMAVPLADEPRLIDPHGGRADLEAGLLRVLHPGSFVDDPTRAIRAARYAARLGFELEPETEELLRATDLGTLSADRSEAELLRLAGEASAADAFGLLAGWGLLEVAPDRLELVAEVREQFETWPWEEVVALDRAVLAAATGPIDGAEELAAGFPPRPAEGVELASGRDPVELVMASALGATWVNRYLAVWRQISLEIDGADLVAAGIPEGPAVGRGLRAALTGRLEGEIFGREQELAAALEAARRG